MAVRTRGAGLVSAMTTSPTTVATAAELAQAIATGAQTIEVTGTITGSPSITLPEGTTLTGGHLVFSAKGVRLTKNNVVRDITISTLAHEVAIDNDTLLADAGTLRLENVITDGQVLLVADEALRAIRVEASTVHVRSADVRGRAEQPHGYGVDVLQGAFTLWNRQADPSSSFTATLDGIAIGQETLPVRGSGLFVAGHGDREGRGDGGLLTADLIRTRDIFTDGGIAKGTPDKITGGVFVVSGAVVERVENAGRTVTHGPNDMVLDNWGSVSVWEASGPVVSTGPSGIGFVNFGSIGRLTVNSAIATTGSGARGFNLYGGSLDEAEFSSIATFGDGSIGIQISRPMGSLTVRGDIETNGTEGMSLVKGVQTNLSAMALSVKDGGALDRLDVRGALRTRGAEVTTLEVTAGGVIKELHLGSIEALGEGSRLTDLAGELPSLQGIPTRQA